MFDDNIHQMYNNVKYPYFNQSQKIQKAFENKNYEHKKSTTYKKNRILSLQYMNYYK